MSQPAVAGPISNDNFAAAQVISGASGLVLGSNIGATGETGEPDHNGTSAPIKSLWYSWTAPATATMFLDTCLASTYNDTLAVYTGTDVAALTPVASNDNTICGDNFRAALTFAATMGTTYSIAVAGSSGEVGHFTLRWSPLSAVSDALAGAIAITGSTGEITGTTTGATGEASEVPNVADASIESVWYAWTAPSSGRVLFHTCSMNYDTTLGAYTGTTHPLAAVTGSNDSCGFRGTRLSFDAVASTTYRISVDGASTSDGTFRLGWDMVVPGADAFADAIVLTGPTGQVASTNIGATGQAGEPNNAASSAPIESIWYDWTPSFSGDVMFQTCVNDLNPTVGAYTGSAVNDLTTVAAADNSSLACGFWPGVAEGALMTFAAEAGTTYHISVDGSFDDESNFILSWVQVLPGPAVDVDLEAGVSDSADPVPAGTTVTYTVRARNLGPGEATNVTGTVSLPVFGTLVSVTPEQGSCGAPAGRFIDCSLGSISSGDGVDVLVAVRMTHAGTWSLALRGLDSDQTDPVSNNNGSSEKTTVTTNGSVVPGVSCTVVGTNGSDNLSGTAGDDRICLLGGSDTSEGRAGNDRIIGGGGGDDLTGGKGSDIVEGGAGNDTLNAKDGVSGNDTVKGGPGTDTCTKDPGDTATGCP